MKKKIRVSMYVWVRSKEKQSQLKQEKEGKQNGVVNE